MDVGLYKSIVWVHGLVGVLARRGIDSDELFSGTGVPAGILSDSRAKISLSEWRTLVRRTMALTNDPGLGLTIGSTAPDSIYQGVGQIVGACRTLREAMRMFERYRPLMGNMNRFELVEEGERAYLMFSALCPDPEVPHFDAELGLSLVYRVPRRYARRESDDADEVWFAHEAPAHAARYADVFGCSVRFGCPRNAILFSRRYLDEEQIYANPTLLDVLREGGERLLTQQGTPSLTDRVRALLRHEPDLQRVDAKSVAKLLKLSVRSFRRQLIEADAPWSLLLDEARCHIACAELRRGITIVELTARLGFSEPSAFNRAFKRWTGMTPAKYSQDGGSVQPRVRLVAGRRAGRKDPSQPGAPAQRDTER
jgi:AraC-like DNA-binding protein